jgi:hypothetical protein
VLEVIGLRNPRSSYRVIAIAEDSEGSERCTRLGETLNPEILNLKPNWRFRGKVRSRRA